MTTTSGADCVRSPEGDARCWFHVVVPDAAERAALDEHLGLHELAVAKRILAEPARCLVAPERVAHALLDEMVDGFEKRGVCPLLARMNHAVLSRQITPYLRSVTTTA